MEDRRYFYDTEALRLALEKTLRKYGPYKLIASPRMNFSRALKSVTNNEIPNFFLKLSYEEKFNSLNMIYSKFDIDLGIVGYRVCFTNNESQKLVEKVQSVSDLKKLVHGQGSSWGDVEILRHSNFNVVEIPKYENLFRMVAKQRFDLFCRGANEIYEEWSYHKHIPNLTYDRTMMIYYPLPRFFYTNSKNAKALRRVEEGLNIAYEDGTLQKLWDKYYLKSVKFAELKKRRVFFIENPLIKNLQYEHKDYSRLQHGIW